MNRLIDEKRAQLEKMCRERHVQRIELFGSATKPDFDPATSDLDFLVTFEELPLNSYADAYFGLLDDLQKLFHRSVDLILESSIRNLYFRQAVDSTRTLGLCDLSPRSICTISARPAN